MIRVVGFVIVALAPRSSGILLTSQAAPPRNMGGPMPPGVRRGFLGAAVFRPVSSTSWDASSASCSSASSRPA